MKSLITTALFVAGITLFTACSSNEIGESKDVAQDKIYQSYNINCFEKDNQLEVFAQFRFAGSNGTTLVLNKPSQVSFDNKILRVDSTTGRGSFYFYNSEAPGTTLYGNHHFIFIDINNKKLENTFSFDSFKLVNVPASISKKQALNLSFEATTSLRIDDYIEVSTSNTDSSFSVTHNTSDKGNFITIPSAELLRQKGKDLILEATVYRTIPLQQATAEGGKINLRYSLKPVKIKLTE